VSRGRMIDVGQVFPCLPIEIVRDIHGDDRRPNKPRCRSRSESQRANGDLPQPVRTAAIAMTGIEQESMVRFGPSKMKSAPAARAREAICMTCSCDTSLYANTTSPTAWARHNASSSLSGTIGMPVG
jgi:hypothetical protein